MLIIVIKVFIQGKIVSGETAPSANTHTHTHEYTDGVLIFFKICSQLKQITNGNLRCGKITEQNRKHDHDHNRIAPRGMIKVFELN